MKTSAVLATYNGEAYLLQQLESIRQQTRPVDEVLICDDGSTDQTVSLAESFIERHRLTGWRVVGHQTNVGYAENYKRALDAAAGEILFPCDQDDVWAPDRVAVMAAAMENEPAVELLNTDYCIFREQPPQNDTPADAGPTRVIPLNRRTFFLQYPGCVMAVRKSFYEAVRPHWQTGIAHDTFLWDMALLRGSGYAMAYCSLYRRVHEGQTSGKLGHSREKRIRYLQSQAALSDCMSRLAVRPADRALCERMAKTHAMRLALLRDGRWQNAFGLLLRLPYYHYKKSYFTEWWMAKKGTV